ncbi:uncharacterized protein TrAFT101_005466 [Trichoderma asperellum]|uniref:uncharacterized protein n=1 Tax=Trichoderma asperellum TaxID=101201 RepID=UPI0033239AE7|nr:hypothetical protein TrAFT101_005466 [Trichoderma asperellum]
MAKALDFGYPSPPLEIPGSTPGVVEFFDFLASDIGLSALALGFRISGEQVLITHQTNTHARRLSGHFRLVKSRKIESVWGD